MSSGERYKKMSEESQDQMLQHVYAQGYTQGWRHAQEAMSEWIKQLGSMDPSIHIQSFKTEIKNQSEFYNLLGQVVASLKTDQEELFENS